MGITGTRETRRTRGNGYPSPMGGEPMGRVPASRHRTPRHFEARELDGISEATMRTHIGLYEGYVRNFNELLDATEQLRQRGDADLPLLRDGLARRLAFEWNGIRLHELFFDSLGGPDSQREPPRDGHLSEAMNRDFGGFHAWQDDVRAMGTTRGIGWVLTVWDPLDDMLSNVWVESHHLGVPAGAVLVLAFDLWEHAWFRDYEPAERSRYLEAVLRNIDYEVAEARLRSRRPWDSPESTRRTEGIGAHGTEN